MSEILKSSYILYRVLCEEKKKKMRKKGKKDVMIVVLNFLKKIT